MVALLDGLLPALQGQQGFFPGMGGFLGQASFLLFCFPHTPPKKILMPCLFFGTAKSTLPPLATQVVALPLEWMKNHEQ